MTKEILAALTHVREYYPSVVIVAINKEGLWQYMDEYFDSPVFDHRINLSILQAAVDSLAPNVLPYIYQLQN